LEDKQKQNMNIREFQGQVAKQGLAKNNRWVCSIFPPSGLTASGRALSNVLTRGGNRINVNLPGLDTLDQGVALLNNLRVDTGSIQVGNNFAIPTLGYALTGMAGKISALNLFTASCSIPTRDMNTQQWTEYGEARNLGGTHTHSDLTIEYYCSEDLRERLFFEQWQDIVFNPISKQYGYYRDYTSRIVVTKYDSSWQNRTAEYTMFEAFPSSVSAIEMTSDAAGDVVKLQVAFKYRNYEITGPGLFDKATGNIRERINSASQRIAIF